MARKEQVICDVCGAQKQDSNHWFIVSASNAWPSAYVNRESEGPVCNDKMFDCCGETCVVKKVSELIGK